MQCIRKSEDNSAGGVYINDIQIQQNLGNPKYADGTYYKAITQNEAKIKVVANNELATVSFGGESKVAELEKIVKLDSKDKVTEIPVTPVTSIPDNDLVTPDTATPVINIPSDEESKPVVEEL